MDMFTPFIARTGKNELEVKTLEVKKVEKKKGIKKLTDEEKEISAEEFGESIDQTVLSHGQKKSIDSDDLIEEDHHFDVFV